MTRDKPVVALGLSGGLVQIQIYGRFQTSCNLNLRKFPFDTQSCSLSFVHMLRPQFYMNGTEPMILPFGVNFTFPRGVRLRRSLYMENSEWEVTDVSVNPYVMEAYDFGENFQVSYAAFDIIIELKRWPKYYVIVVIIPLFILAIISNLGYLLPTESGERVSLQVTVSLSFMFLLLVVVDVIPPTGTNFPILGTNRFQFLAHLIQRYQMFLCYRKLEICKFWERIGSRS